MDPLTWLAKWYESRCDGEWESEYGINIESVNNPGWMVRVDLDGTGLDPDAFVPIAQQRSEADWVECKVQEGIWLGGGGIGNLNEVIGIFREYAEGKSPLRDKPRFPKPQHRSGGGHNPKFNKPRGPHGPRGRQ